jgi:hypothetical protein
MPCSSTGELRCTGEADENRKHFCQATTVTRSNVLLAPASQRSSQRFIGYLFYSGIDCLRTNMAVALWLRSPVGDDRNEVPTLKTKHLVFFERKSPDQ